MADSSSRLAYLDWARGVACLLMFQTHCYDAWLGGDARKTAFFHWTRLGGTMPAPLFLFIAGIAVVLVSDRSVAKGAAPRLVARATMRRGAQIFGLALLFRLQEFILGQPKAPWTDLLRVDVLNIIGVSLVLLGAFFGLIWSAADNQSGGAAMAEHSRARAGILAAMIAGIVAVVTPLLWNNLRLRWLPWYLESYVNGVHIFGRPQSYLFPLFPWTAFAFAGFAAGCFLVSPWARRRDFAAVCLTALTGGALLALGFWLDARPQLYAVYDFWHSSPNFFLIRVGLVTTVLALGYVWCRWAPSLWSFSPVLEIGRQSLLVYWVSIELAYGGLSLLKKHAQDIPTATFGMIALTLAMIALAAFRNRTKGRPLKEWFPWRGTEGAGASAGAAGASA